MQKIAICDDNPQYLELIRVKIDDYCIEKGLNIQLEYFQDSSLLAEYTEEKKLYDAYILDVEMPNVSGLELSELIRTKSETAYVIFLTAHESYALKGYGINVLDYILKENVEIELPMVLDKLFERLFRATNHKAYLINTQRKYIKLLHKEIIYIYKYKKNVTFVLRNNKEETERTTLQEVYKRLDNPHMYFLDRSVIINVEHIRCIFGDCIEMVDGHKITSTRARIQELKSFLI